MNRLNSILLPTDFSAAVGDIAPHVREMARRFHARLTVVHAFDLIPAYAVPLPATARRESQPPALPYTAELRELRNERQRHLQEFTNGLFTDIPHAAIIEDGQAAAVIEGVARREKADLIVMPTRGHGTFRRLLLGSVTAKVLHDTRFPILTNAHQPGATWAAGGGFRSILCAIEINREANAILDAGGLFASVYGARLSVVHVESTPPLSKPDEVFAESVRQEIRLALNRYDNGKNGDVRLLDASVPEGIRQAASEEKADLVIVGRGHEKGTVSRMWSALYSIIRESPCPVLSVTPINPDGQGTSPDPRET